MVTTVVLCIRDVMLAGRIHDCREELNLFVEFISCLPEQAFHAFVKCRSYLHNFCSTRHCVFARRRGISFLSIPAKAKGDCQ